jgi:hypothetical protein
MMLFYFFCLYRKWIKVPFRDILYEKPYLNRAPKERSMIGMAKLCIHSLSQVISCFSTLDSFEDVPVFNMGYQDGLINELIDALEIILNSHEDIFYACSYQIAATMIALMKKNLACIK